MSEALIRFLQNRKSVIRLEPPAPPETVIQEAYQAAMRVPDHAQLKPARWLLIQGDGREALGQLYAKALLRRSAEATEAALERSTQMPLRSPLLIVVIACVSEHPKVPPSEQILSAGCGAYAALLAFEAAGFGGIWRTGDVAYDPLIAEGLGLEDNEQIIGYLYIGTPSESEKQRDLSVPDFEDRVKHWPLP